MNRPRVCLLTETYHPVRGGGETQARTLAEGLVERGWSVLLLTRRSDPGFPVQEVSDHLTVRRLRPVGPGRRRKWGLLFFAAWALLRYRDSYDAVIVSGFRILGFAAVPVCQVLGKKVALKADSVGEMDGSYFEPGLSGSRLRAGSVLFRWLLGVRNAVIRRSDAFVAISTPLAEELEAAGVEPERIARIPNSVDIEGFAPPTDEVKAAARERLDIPADRALFVYTGRLVTYKGLPTLVRAWAASDRLRSSGLLLLVGGGGLDMHDCEAELEALVSELDLSESVRLTGDVGDVRPFLMAADAFVFPTENEAFGIALVEAMACGLPVVSTAVGGIADFLVDGVNGVRVAPGRADETKQAMEALVDAPRRAAELGRAARATVEERFSSDGVVRAYEGLLSALLGVSPTQGQGVPIHAA